MSAINRHKHAVVKVWGFFLVISVNSVEWHHCWKKLCSHIETISLPALLVLFQGSATAAFQTWCADSFAAIRWALKTVISPKSKMYSMLFHFH